MIDALRTAFAGMSRAAGRLETIAGRVALSGGDQADGSPAGAADGGPPVAGPGNPPASPPVLPVDLATEMTNLLSARISYSANAKVAELVRDLEKDTLDRLA